MIPMRRRSRAVARVTTRRPTGSSNERDRSIGRRGATGHRPPTVSLFMTSHDSPPMAVRPTDRATTKRSRSPPSTSTDDDDVDRRRERDRRRDRARDFALDFAHSRRRVVFFERHPFEFVRVGRDVARARATTRGRSSIASEEASASRLELELELESEIGVAKTTATTSDGEK